MEETNEKVVSDSFEGDSRRDEASSSSLSGSRGWHKLTIMVLVIVAVALIPVFSSRGSPPETSSTKEQESGRDYSKFTHTNPMHSRLPCLLCHRRETNDARPLRPGRDGHMPCAGCHAPFFTRKEGTMCAICHTDSQKGELKPFPPLRSFGVKFDHARHVRSGGTGCATCHRPSRGGVAMSIPAGLRGHSTCYRCHTPRAESNGRDISTCGTCHELGQYSRTSESARAFKVGFSHAAHGALQKLSCNDCHGVRAGRSRGNQVTKPLPLNHHAPPGARSCMTCHDGKRAFGGDDFASCKRCHTGATWQF